MENENMNKYIKARHIRMVDSFNNELDAFRRETEAEAAELYENIYTSFTLANVRVEDGCLVFEYDGNTESENMVHQDPETSEWYEKDLDGIVEWIKFWRKCLNRAKKYWSMNPDTLDAIYDEKESDVEIEN
jgi:hypothetical protein